MRRQDREGPAARRTEIELDPLLERALRIGIPPITSMAVDHPRATAGTGRALSLELIFAELDRGASPKSSRLIKPLSSGLHDAVRPAFFTDVLHPRSHYFPQRYSNHVVAEGLVEKAVELRQMIADALKITIADEDDYVASAAVIVDRLTMTAFQ